MNPSLELLARLGIALIPGIVNLLAAFDELDKQAKFLVFFRPSRSLGFWLWLLVQLLLPGVLFWYWLDLPNKSIDDFDTKFIIEEAVAKGLIFIAVVNSSVEIGSLPINIKTFYNAVIQQIFRLIDRRQAAVTSEFWTEFEEALLASEPGDLQRGLKYLENYFTRGLRLPQEKKDYREKLQKVRDESDRERKVSALIDVMDVRRRDLTRALGWFHCQALKDKFDRGWPS